MNSPAISVVMPVFNSERYLAEAIESILDQTFTDFEFLIFDDGSSDRSPDIIRAYAEKDARIIADFAPENKGYVVHLNEGIRRACGQYIARMDSDDVALRRRLEIQKEFLDCHPEIAVVGSSSIRVNQNGEKTEFSRRQASPSYLYWQCFFTNPFSHPTVMYRKGAIASVGGYDERKMPAEDYDLWSRLLPVWQLANMEEPLLKYREHSESISVRKREAQLKNSSETLAALWRSELGIGIGHDEVVFLKGYHKGYEDLPNELSCLMFRKLWALRRMVLKKFHDVDDQVHRDIFVKCAYLATKARATSAFHLFPIVGRLMFCYPRFVTRQLIYGRI